MSDMSGSGYGSSHDWRNLGTEFRRTLWKCARCGAGFWHCYPSEPNIYKAMAQVGVPNECAAPKGEEPKA